MSRAILALSLYDLSWSLRPDGDCIMSDDVVRWVSAPAAARYPRAIGRPSLCQVSHPCSRLTLSRPRGGPLFSISFSPPPRRGLSQGLLEAWGRALLAQGVGARVVDGTIWSFAIQPSLYPMSTRRVTRGSRHFHRARNPKCRDELSCLLCRSTIILSSSGGMADAPLRLLPRREGANDRDEARDDRDRLDMPSLTEPTTFVKGPKAMASYKASRGFESSLEKMGKISYEFGYQMALELLRAKYPEAEVEQDPFDECPEDGNVKMDLCHPFDDNTPSEK
ncbi:hypothetical protein B296_00048712 [Ensete ventricosum]|uniref:Uncharacterized protein n=1 Tax=Ensete ventricosum TaxID=4639 RepID=A0A426YTR0_ENSVE|nr:hypothetical protein B296_00048712 [Ensete ventricosum]